MTSVTTTCSPDIVDRTTYREVLARPLFRLLFVTRTLAVVADSLRITTLSVLIYTTTGSPLLGALAFGVGFAPQLLGTLLLGALADRGRPRPLIIAGYLLPALAAAAPALVRLPTAATLALIGAVSCLTPVFGAASSRLIAAELTGDAYVLGRSLGNLASSGGQLLGLAGAGLAVTALGARGALLVSGAGYLLAALLIRLRLPALSAPPAATEGAPVLRHSWTGNRALLADRTVRRLLLAQWLPPAFAAGAEGLVVAYVGERGLSPGFTALLLGALPVGMLIGDLVVGRLLRPVRRERLVAPLVGVLGLPLLGFALHPGAGQGALLLTVAGAGFSYALGVQRGFLTAVPGDRQGQAFGLLSAGMMTLQGLGPALFGGLAQLTTAADAMACAGGAVLLAAGWIWRCVSDSLVQVD
ncbi:MFS transporter [Kitasatospora kifunensis]|uniref:Putative MFS family arabinose efflux permease n=1 Tax=Kitasatospora kifunensis TaxID=58351 RepID=A0A7W7R6X4_KITKI|nr:MFS transporter [Kitasatospora kifunensis]MBB4926435.1 putative MFS family arabinose efflux permease [Kitasatospora kifunensis]